MQPIEAADFHELATPSDPQLSPEGEHVAFVRTEADDDESYESTVYVADVDGECVRRFTVAEGTDAEPRWSPSGDRLAFTATRGADDDRQQLWVLPIGGGEARRVTDVVGGVSDVSWSPDGTRIAFTQAVTAADREEERDLQVSDDYEPEDPDPRVHDRTVYRSMQCYFDDQRSHVYTVDVGAGVDDGSAAPGDDEVTRWTDGDADFDGVEWGDDDTLYYTESVGDDPDDSYEIAIHAHDLADDEVERIHTTTGWGTSIAATADGKVAFAHTEPEQASIQGTDLHVLHRADDEVVDVTAEIDRGLGYGAGVQWGPDDETVYFATPDEGQTALWHAPGDASEPPARLVREGTVSGGDVSGSDGAGPDEVDVALAMSQWDHPGDVFHYDAASGETTRLTELNADYLDERHVGEPEELWIEAPGAEIQAWVLTPPGFDAAESGDAGESGDADGTDEQYPLIAEIHGGPHGMWSTAGTMWHEFQTLAARGYVVFWSNPRGSTGYGEAFMQAIERDWGEVTLTDVMAGVEEVAARDYVDADNAFVTGGSFGGFMTAWAVGQTDYFEAAVAQRGVYDLTGFYGSTDGAYKLLEGDFDTLPWEEPEWLWEQSPTGHAHEVDTPTLLIHSDDDTRTPVCTAELYHRILRKNGVDTRLVRYPREGHELSRSGEPAHRVDRIERIARWFDGYSAFHDAPPALERDDDADLTAGEDDEDDADDKDGRGDGESGN